MITRCVMFVLIIAAATLQAGGESRLPIDSYSAEVKRYGIACSISLDDKGNLKEIHVIRRGKKFTVPQADLELIGKPSLSRVQVLGTGTQGAEPVHVIVSFDYGDIVSHEDLVSKSEVLVASRVRYLFSLVEYQGLELAIPLEDSKNRWRLFEKIGNGMMSPVGEVESTRCPLGVSE